MSDGQSPLGPTTAEDPQVEIRAANQANAVTAIYGISGSGKSSLADTAAEYTWEEFGRTTDCVVADPGGFGNKRLALIRAGIMRVWDPRNHVDPFATMEMISMGAFPATLIDPERGYAAPDVPLVLPQRMLHVLYCPQGHDVARAPHPAIWAVQAATCPTCGVMTNLTNASKVEKLITRPKMFASRGLFILDSMTALNDWGLADLQYQSANGKLPVSASGGSALAGADALTSGQFKFSTGSKAQVGFLQNRTYVWLCNIRSIPDLVVPPVVTFMVEEAGGSDETGGEAQRGPKIAGNARTGHLPGWVGNLLHATTEPSDDGAMVHRLWLTNHIDPRDPKKIPYVAKHRGTPLNMPKYLEDKVGELPWSGCSLKVFFTLLHEQLIALDAETKTKYPNAPGIWRGDASTDADEIVGVAAHSGGRATTGNGPGGGGSAVAATPTVTGGRTLRSRSGGRVAGIPATGMPAPTMATQPGASTTQPSVPPPTSVTTAPIAVSDSTPNTQPAGPAPSSPSVIATQLQATLDATAAASTGQVLAAVSTPSSATTPATSTSTPVPPPTPMAHPPAAGARPLRRAARPPV